MKTRRLMSFLLSMTMFLLLFTLTGCDEIEKAKAALEKAIGDIEKTGKTVAEAMNELNTTLKTIKGKELRHDLENTAKTAIASANIGVMCLTDHLKENVLNELKFKVSLLNIELEKRKPKGTQKKIDIYYPPTLVCSVVPNIIDLSIEPNRRNRIDVYGYKFYDTLRKGKEFHPYRAYLKYANSSLNKNIDNSVYLTSTYQLTLDLSRVDFQTINPKPLSIIITDDKSLVQEIPIILVQRNPLPPCNNNPIDFRSTEIHVPADKWVYGGDEDFYGNGPTINFSCTIFQVDARLIKINLGIFAKENGGNGTQLRGDMSQIFYRMDDPNFIIEKILTQNLSFSDTYIDGKSGEDEEKRMAQGEIVEKIIYTGDTGTKDTGLTKAVVFFNPIKIQLRQIANCIND